MKTVYWTVAERGTGFYKIDFWTKPDKSNSLNFKVVTLDEEKIAKRIANIIGTDHFDLVQVNPKLTKQKAFTQD